VIGVYLAFFYRKKKKGTAKKIEKTSVTDDQGRSVPQTFETQSVAPGTGYGNEYETRPQNHEPFFEEKGVYENDWLNEGDRDYNKTNDNDFLDYNRK